MSRAERADDDVSAENADGPRPPNQTIGGDTIERDFDTDLGMRMYKCDGDKLPSVTSALGLDPEVKAGITDWTVEHRGHGDDYKAEHITWYTANRGTLAHAEALAPLYEQVYGRRLWGDEEDRAKAQLFELSDKKVRGDSWASVLYSVMKWMGEAETRREFRERFGWRLSDLPENPLLTLAERDIGEFANQFQDIGETLGFVGPGSEVFDVERMLFNPTLQVAGQIDLLYRDRLGDIVAADLKTSGRLRSKMKRQVVAYAKAHPLQVDRVEVIRIQPGAHGSVAVHAPREEGEPTRYHTTEGWPETRTQLWETYNRFATEAVSMADVAPR